MMNLQELFSLRKEKKWDELSEIQESIYDALGANSYIKATLLDLDFERVVIQRGAGGGLCNIISDGSGRCYLFEKILKNDSREVRFWRQQGKSRYNINLTTCFILPIEGIYDVPGFTFLYSPFQPELLRKFRPSLFLQEPDDAIKAVKALAEFNSSNVVSSGVIDNTESVRFTGKRLSTQLLSNSIGITNVNQLEVILTEHQRVHREMINFDKALRSRSVFCLSHNDVGPGNLFFINKQVMFIDMGLASISRLGSDMHTIIRWCVKATKVRSYADYLIDVYCQEVCKYLSEINLESVRDNCWVTFFKRYSAPHAWGSAQKLEPFFLALRKGQELILKR